jgi:ribosomal protein S12 methylthiotransferase accessory factor
MTEVLSGATEADAPHAKGRTVLGLLGTEWLIPARGSVVASMVDWVIVTEPGTSPDRCHALVVGADDARLHEVARAWSARRSAPWLPVSADGGVIVVGPVVIPGSPGCPTCVQRRQRGNDPHAAGRIALCARLGGHLDPRPPRVNPFVIGPVTELIADEVARLRCGRPDVRTRGALLRIVVDTGETTRHLILADPLCPDCAQLPLDRPEPDRYVFTPVRKISPAVLRTRDPAVETLEQRYVDPVTGVVAAVWSWSEPATAAAVARLSPVDATSPGQHGYGRGFDRRSARRTALFEALERLAGFAPRGRSGNVVAAYRDVADRALDPATLGLQSEHRYQSPDFPLTRYTPNREMRWVWGYSFGREEPILVPETCVYYGLGRASETFVYESSNGCALGGCLAEAILHGLLEVIERDAFLLTWYARLPVPEIDLRSAADRRIPLLAERARHALGYRLHAFAATPELGVPCFWVMAVADGDDPNRMKALCGAGSHPDPERALLRALRELVGFLPGMAERYDPVAAARMLADPEEVRRMDDHSMLYGHPGAFDRLKFLFEGGSPRSLRELTGGRVWPEHDDITADLAELTSRCLSSGLDVIAVDQTSPEHRDTGLACAKVLVPGLLAMTFGHQFRRTDGISRLRGAPRLLGFGERDLRPEEINPHPHPFP